jgi:hypothetical protein
MRLNTTLLSTFPLREILLTKSYKNRGLNKSFPLIAIAACSGRPGMPAKRHKTRHDFNVLSTDDINDSDEGKEDSKKDGSVPRVMRVTDAPTNSKFYTDAQTYGFLKEEPKLTL